MQHVFLRLARAACIAGLVLSWGAAPALATITQKFGQVKMQAGTDFNTNKAGQKGHFPARTTRNWIAGMPDVSVPGDAGSKFDASGKTKDPLSAVNTGSITSASTSTASGKVNITSTRSLAPNSVPGASLKDIKNAEASYAGEWSYIASFDKTTTLTLQYLFEGQDQVTGDGFWQFDVTRSSDNEQLQRWNSDLNPGGKGTVTLTFGPGEYLFDLIATGDHPAPLKADYNSGINAEFDWDFKEQPVGTVPELSTWALMLCGFGATGAAMRSSRRRVRAIV